ncbi:hypothetical protein TMP227_50051 [Tenacibaculum maritimum]|uniref:plasmid mobilization protein n=1 Tax=Tenacibaculum maritimum TaxID=107401 RepID=UPI0012E45FF9|nr:plasmid mobilization relaxosome protein MobC [Tenacibaculum maritimum]CAA0228951.1 hypothetical protein TMP227_50051 [Tenacibaculum maritimum]
MKKDNKVKYIRVRITDLENETIRKEAENLGFRHNISEFIRRKILRKKMVTVNPNKLIDELYSLRFELNKIGSNLNQIANYTNFLAKNNYVEYSHIENLKEIGKIFEIHVSDLKNKIDRTLDTI